MGSSSSLHLAEVTGCVWGWILTEPISLSSGSEWQCWISSGMSRCSPSSAGPHSVSSTARAAEKVWDKHIYIGRVTAGAWGWMYGHKKKKWSYSSITSGLLLVILLSKNAKVWLLNDIKVWFSSGLAWPGSSLLWAGEGFAHLALLAEVARPTAGYWNLGVT